MLDVRDPDTVAPFRPCPFPHRPLARQTRFPLQGRISRHTRLDHPDHLPHRTTSFPFHTGSVPHDRDFPGDRARDRDFASWDPDSWESQRARQRLRPCRIQGVEGVCEY